MARAPSRGGCRTPPPVGNQVARPCCSRVARKSGCGPWRHGHLGSVMKKQPERFRNTATLTVAITFTVAGGARVDTARRRGERLAARLADAATRAADTVEVSARLHKGVPVELNHVGRAVLFGSANTGLDGSRTAGNRWIDPEHETAQQSLAAANATARAVREADLERRREVGCRNPSRLYPDWSCRCVYCRPLDHMETAMVSVPRGEPPAPLCPCGNAAERHGRCPAPRAPRPCRPEPRPTGAPAAQRPREPRPRTRAAMTITATTSVITTTTPTHFQQDRPTTQRTGSRDGHPSSTPTVRTGGSSSTRRCTVRCRHTTKHGHRIALANAGGGRC